jgi:drug/metabolite transporter (DMT)-like permease
VQFKKFFQLGPVLIVIAALLWALDGVLRRSLFSLPPITIVFLEHLIGSLLLIPFVARTFTTKKMTKQVWLLLTIIALLSGLLGTLWFTTALVKTNFIPFSVVFLLQKLQPLFAIGTAAVLLKEKVTRQYLPWAGLAVASAYFVTFPNGVVNFATGADTVTAALFAVGAAAAWGTATAFSRMLLTKISHTQATGWRFFLTTIFAGVGMFLMNAQASVVTVEPGQLFRLLIIALSTGMLALWLYYRGLEKTEAKISTLLELAFPLSAVFIDMYVFKSFLQPSQYIAAVVLMFAIYQVGKLGVTKQVQIAVKNPSK